MAARLVDIDESARLSSCDDARRLGLSDNERACVAVVCSCDMVFQKCLYFLPMRRGMLIERKGKKKKKTGVYERLTGVGKRKPVSNFFFLDWSGIKVVCEENFFILSRFSCGI